MSLRDSILTADDLRREKVSAWGVEFFLATMTGEQREVYEGNLFKADGSGEVARGRLRATLVACTAVDEAGNAIFTEADIEALSRKSSVELRRLAEIAGRLNGLSAEAQEQAAKK